MQAVGSTYLNSTILRLCCRDSSLIDQAGPLAMSCANVAELTGVLDAFLDAVDLDEVGGQVGPELLLC